MTILTEYRLRCDYCGAKSPVVLNWPDGGDYEKLPTWTRWVAPALFSEPKHFCCEEHRAAFERTGRAFGMEAVIIHPPPPPNPAITPETVKGNMPSRPMLRRLYSGKGDIQP